MPGVTVAVVASGQYTISYRSTSAGCSGGSQETNRRFSPASTRVRVGAGGLWLS